MKKQKVLLGFLLIFLAAAVANALRGASPPQRVDASASVRAVPSPPSAPNQDVDRSAKRLQLERLAREQSDFPGVTRDIFVMGRTSPRSPQAKPPAPPKPAEKPSPIALAAPSPARLIPVPVAPSLQRDLGQFTFLGFLQKDGEKSLFLSSRDGIFIAKKGDRFGKGEEFTITDISQEKLLIRRGDSPGVITVTLREQFPLSASSLPSRPPREPQRRALPDPEPPSAEDAEDGEERSGDRPVESDVPNAQEDPHA